LSQLRIAETEKFRHVTSFFNQGQENPYQGEERILIPSPKVATYDLAPQMSAGKITEELCKAIESGKFNLIVCNYANADMVGHSGNFEATKQAISFLDECLAKVIKACSENQTSVLITADHGNADQMVNSNGTLRTAHSLNKVPVILVEEKHKDKKLQSGALCDLAPTILDLMNLAKPKEMTGKSLLN
jgi:2,3-bisphosphoglycerate-independent phosphoglycerate mutase